MVQASIDFDTTAELQILLDDKVTLGVADFVF